MGRLFQSGLELNSIAEEWTGSAGSPAIVTSPVHGGSYALEITSLVSATAKYVSYQFASAVAGGPYYFRVYFRYATLPSATNRIISLGVSGISLTSAGALQLIANGVQIGSNSAALSSGRWYCVEIKYDATPASGSRVLAARLDGTVFATSSTLTSTQVPTIDLIRLGGNIQSEAQTTGAWYFDDLAINDTTTSDQNSYPGPGKIIHVHPNAAGDNNQWSIATGGTAGIANNYTRVLEVTPDTTTYNNDSTVGHLDDYSCGASGIPPGSLISCVAVGLWYAGNSTTSNGGFKPRIKKASGGTVTEGAEIIPTTNTFGLNANAIPKNYPLVLYRDPDGNPWTQATVDTLQIGAHLTTTGNAVRLSTIWASIDYMPQAQAAANAALKAVGLQVNAPASAGLQGTVIGDPGPLPAQGKSGNSSVANPSIAFDADVQVGSVIAIAQMQLGSSYPGVPAFSGTAVLGALQTGLNAGSGPNLAARMDFARVLASGSLTVQLSTTAHSAYSIAELANINATGDLTFVDGASSTNGSTSSLTVPNVSSGYYVVAAMFSTANGVITPGNTGVTGTASANGSCELEVALASTTSQVMTWSNPGGVLATVGVGLFTTTFPTSPVASALAALQAAGISSLSVANVALQSVNNTQSAPSGSVFQAMGRAANAVAAGALQKIAGLSQAVANASFSTESVLNAQAGAVFSTQKLLNAPARAGLQAVALVLVAPARAGLRGSGVVAQGVANAAFEKLVNLANAQANVALLKSANTRQAASAVALVQTNTRLAQASVGLRGTSTPNAPARAALVQTNPVTALANAALDKIGNLAQAVANAALQKAANTQQAQAGAALQSVALVRNVAVNVALQKTGNLAQAVANAAFQSVALQRSAQVNAALQSTALQRAAPANAGLESVGLQRNAPARAGLQSVALTANAPARAGFQATVQVNGAASVALERIGNSVQAIANGALLTVAAQRSAVANAAFVQTKSAAAQAGAQIASGDTTPPTVVYVMSGR